MDDFKIILFKEQHKFDFPNYFSLSKMDCEKLQMKIQRKFKASDVNNLINILEQSTSLLFIENEFNLIYLLKKQKINFNPDIYISWTYLSNIDCIKMEDLDRYFFELWFPSSDDIEIFDNNLNWILFVRHDGFVSLSRVNSPL